MKANSCIQIVFCILLFSSCKTNDTVISNYYGRFKTIGANNIQPKGWLKKYLITQRNGLTGYLENAGYPFNQPVWEVDSMQGNTSIEKWWPYEQTAYWIDGMLRCGLLLNDEFLLNKARKSIYHVINHPDADGFLGPKFAKHNFERDRWIYVVFFRALMAEYEATGNKQILAALKKHYFNDIKNHLGIRESINTEIIAWLYEKSGDPIFLKQALEIYHLSDSANKEAIVTAKSFMQDVPATGEHGVTYLEKAKIGSILYLYTGQKEYLEATIKAFDKLDKYHMLVSGVNSSSEHIELVNTQETHEICDISDYTWNISYLLKATGNVKYADAIERVAFNAAPGSVTNDFKALQYFSGPNQVIAAKGNYIKGGGNQMRYAPNPGTECCPGNVNRMMPNYAINAWMTDGNGGIAATLYAPSVLTYFAGNENKKVVVNESTNYPFSDTIQFIFDEADEVTFNFYVRIPNWCSNAKVLVNEQPINKKITQGTYIAINRTYNKGDIIKVVLPSKFKVTKQVENGVAVEKGPIVYSLKVEENWKIDSTDKRSNSVYPAYELFPKSDWNYALKLDEKNIESQIQVIKHNVTTSPWSLQNAPVELKIPAIKIKEWTLLEKSEMPFENWDVTRDAGGHVTSWYIKDKKLVKGKWFFSPLLPTKEVLKKYKTGIVDTVTLIPYGCSRLRVTIFPKID